MAKKIMVDIAPIIEKLKAYRKTMSDMGCGSSLLLGVDSCLEITSDNYTYQLKLRKREYKGMLNGMCKTYETMLETRDPINFGDLEAMILDNLVFSNASLAMQIEDLSNCDPEDFKKMALVLAKKEL